MSPLTERPIGYAEPSTPNHRPTTLAVCLAASVAVALGALWAWYGTAQLRWLTLLVPLGILALYGALRWLLSTR